MEPANLNKPFCGLCLGTVRNTNCQKIDVVSDILEIVLPDVNLEEIYKHFVCEVCSVKLFAAFNFKSICINTEDIIFPHIIASKKAPVDLKEVYLKEKGSIQLNISEDQRICRLCFQLITSVFVSLNEVDVDIIDTYIPQVVSIFENISQEITCRHFSTKTCYLRFQLENMLSQIKLEKHASSDL